MFLDRKILIMSFFFIYVGLKGQLDNASMQKSEWEVFPIINYDTDVGFGYGAKGFLYNFLNSKKVLT